MTFQIIERPLDATVDVQTDGEPWPFVLVRENDTILADLAGDLVSFLIEGYEDIAPGAAGNDEALLARAAAAIRTASMAQAMFAADAANDGTVDFNTESENVLTALFSDRTIPTIGIDRWEHAVPLVLVATDYEPFTDEVPPSGNVLWIDPSDEVAYLQSLANLGIIRFYMHETV